MPGADATAGDVRNAIARGLNTHQVHDHIRRTTSWAFPLELLEQAIAHDDPEYIDETPLIELALRPVSPRVSNALTRAVLFGQYV